jgi:hypothetical protein
MNVVIAVIHRRRRLQMSAFTVDADNKTTGCTKPDGTAAVAAAVAQRARQKSKVSSPAAKDEKRKKAKRANKAQPKKARRKRAELRAGSKAAQVVTMLQRKGGATLAEITAKMGCQKHTVRGFMAGSMRMAGYAVESFKPEGGERTYRIK